MYSYECNVGRLVEVRFDEMVSIEDIDGVGRDARRLMARNDTRYVCAVDMRRTRVLAPNVADALLEGLRPFNPRVERTAVLVDGESPTLALQIERLHREAGDATRRTFDEPRFMRTWLGLVLTEAERARLAVFLT
jgi:hypothetical protein